MMIKALTLFFLIQWISSSESMPVEQTQEEIRASLITKDNFMERRRERKEIKVPPSFTISTNLLVKSSSPSENRQPKGLIPKGFKDIRVIEGVRMPDDKTDRITWRNGRVINNIFVRDDEPLPKETVVRSNVLNSLKKRGPSFSSSLRQGREISSHVLPTLPTPPLHLEKEDRSDARDYSYRAGNANNGRPVYYVVEETDSLHSDRSPYLYEPANIPTPPPSPYSSSKLSDFGQPSISHASSDDFIIKEHTYSLCPGCPSFSIPVPVPKANVDPEYYFDNSVGEKHSSQNAYEPVYQHARNETFLEKIGNRIISTVQGIQDRILEATNQGPKIFNFKNQNDQLSEKDGEISSAGGGSQINPAIAAAGAAAVAAFGGLAYYVSTSFEAHDPGTFRSFDSSESSAQKLEAVLREWEEKYGDMEDKPPKCIPEEKCLILIKHLSSSPELVRAKKYYEQNHNIKTEELCGVLKCLPEDPPADD